MNKLQRDITFKALRLLAQLEGVELPTELKEVADKVAEQNPYETHITDILGVMEGMLPDIKANEDYELYNIEDLVKRHAKAFDTLEDLAEIINVTEIEQEISTAIDVHENLEELVDYIEVELDLEGVTLENLLAGNTNQRLEIYALQNGTYATLFE